MPTTKPRSELAIHERAMRLELPDAIAETSRLLGPKLVAYICGVSETRLVRAWADGERSPRGHAEPRLRLALWIASLIAERDNEHVAQAWFQGLNPQLDDRSPARLLRDGDPDEIGPEVLAAARTFVVGG